MTDAEKQELKKLSTDDLIDMLSAARDEIDRLSETDRAERHKIINDFFGAERDNDDESEPPTPEKIDAFERLKRKFA